MTAPTPILTPEEIANARTMADEDCRRLGISTERAYRILASHEALRAEAENWRLADAARRDEVEALRAELVTVRQALARKAETST